MMLSSLKHAFGNIYFKLKYHIFSQSLNTYQLSVKNMKDGGVASIAYALSRPLLQLYGVELASWPFWASVFLSVK